GANAHAVLEEAPSVAPAGPAAGWQVVPLSARGREAVDVASRRLADHLDAHPELNLAEVAATLQDGRRDLPVRRFVAAADVPDLVAVLRGDEPHRLVTRTAPEQPGRAVFMFPGAGNQYRDMAVDLYRTRPPFRAEVDRCAELLRGRLDGD